MLLDVFLPVEMAHLPLKLRYETRKDACEKTEKQDECWLSRLKAAGKGLVVTRLSSMDNPKPESPNDVC